MTDAGTPGGVGTAALPGPRGAAWPVPAGAVVVGLAAYGFLVVSARALGPERYAPLAALWGLVFTLAPGLFLPLEQEVARAVAARRARGEGAGAVVRTAALLGGGAVLLVLLVAAPLSPLLVRRLFDGEGLLLAGLALSLVGYAASHLLRGLLAGAGRPGPYGAMLALEGLLRLAPAALLAGAAVTGVAAYGVVAGAAPLVAVALVLPWSRCTGGTGPPAPARELGRNLGLLLASSLLGQALINLGPLVVKLLATPAQAGAAGALLAGLALARAPVLALSPAQAVLLPHLTTAYADGDLARVRRTIAGCVVAVVLLFGLAAPAAALAGPAVVGLLFGEAFALPRLDLVLLVLGVGGYCLALLVSFALIAAERHAALARCWAGGLAVAAVVVALVPGLLLRVELGLLLGSVAAAGLMLAATGLRRSRSAARTATAATAARGRSRRSRR